MGEHYSELGRICMAQRAYDEAAVLFGKAAASRAEAAGRNEIEIVPDLLMMARALARGGKTADASMAMARCVAIERRALANPALDKRTLSGEVVGLDWELQVISEDEWLLYQGEWDQAVAGFRAKVEYERGSAVVGDPEGMPYLEKLAEALEGQGDWGAAGECYREAAAEWEKRLSAGHPRAEWCRERAAELERHPVCD